MSDIDDLRDEVWHLRADLRTRARSEANNIYSLTNTVAGIVPVIYPGNTYTPADLYYAQWGISGASGTSPAWMSDNSGTNQTLAQWDSTDGRAYRLLGGAGGVGSLGTFTSATNLVIYPTGVGGAATTFSPKNANVVRVLVSSRLKFPDNVDLRASGGGWGAARVGSAGGDFNNATSYFFCVTRSGGGHWRLWTCDNSTASSTDSSAADDANWHDFKIDWALGTTPTINLYVDGVLAITKTSNLPNRPLAAFCSGIDATHRLQIVDYSVTWSAT